MSDEGNLTCIFKDTDLLFKAIVKECSLIYLICLYYFENCISFVFCMFYFMYFKIVLKIVTDFFFLFKSNCQRDPTMV